jgi:hypothetical protein
MSNKQEVSSKKKEADSKQQTNYKDMPNFRRLIEEVKANTTNKQAEEKRNG